MKNSKILITVIVIIIIAAGAGIYYFVLPGFLAAPVSVLKNNSLPSPSQNNTPLPQKKMPVTPQEQAAEIQKDYPETITGVINFLDTKKSYKATIKTSDGKVYVLWPPQPESIYGAIGIKNGQNVSVQGKINSQGNLEWATIK